MDHRLVFVCEANVCRSPLMAFAFGEQVRGAGGAEGWSIASSGVDVVVDRAICAVVGELIADSGHGAAFARDHRATSLATVELATQDLIVVATRAERGLVAQGDPGLRERTFTLREAIALGGDDPVVGVPRPAPGEVPSLRTYAARLNERRGLIAPVRRRFASARVAEASWDTPDVHHKGHRRHRRQLVRLRNDVRRFHAQVQAYLADEAPSGSGARDPR